MRNYSHLVWPETPQSWKKAFTLKWLIESSVLVGPSPRCYSFTSATVRTHVHTHRNQQRPIEIWRSSVWVVLSRLSQPLPSGVCTWLSFRALRATRFMAQFPVYTTHNKLCFPQKNLHRHCLIVLFLLTWTTGTGWFFFFTGTTVIIRRDWKQQLCNLFFPDNLYHGQYEKGEWSIDEFHMFFSYDTQVANVPCECVSSSKEFEKINRHDNFLWPFSH